MGDKNIFHLFVFLSDTTNHFLGNVFQILSFLWNKRTLKDTWLPTLIFGGAGNFIDSVQSLLELIYNLNSPIDLYMGWHPHGAISQ